jgi:hypothetical protein
MVLVGGTSTIYGPIVAGILLTYISELLAGLGPIRFMVVAVIIVITIRFFQQGVWGIARRIFSRPAESLEFSSEEIHHTSPEVQETTNRSEQFGDPPPATKL